MNSALHANNIVRGISIFEHQLFDVNSPRQAWATFFDPFGTSVACLVWPQVSLLSATAYHSECVLHPR